MIIPGEDDTELTIDPVQFTDFGNYICVASINVSGTINETESDEATLFGKLLYSGTSLLWTPPLGPI